MSAEGHPVLVVLRKAARGLIVMSEADHPLRPFAWTRDDMGGSELTEHGVRAIRCVPQDAPVEVLTVAEFLGPSARREDWHGEDERRMADGFAHLIDVLKSTLKDVRVYKYGDAAKDVVIVGLTSDGSFAGLTTRVVET